MRYKRERHVKPLSLIRQQHLEECLDHIGVISTPTRLRIKRKYARCMQMAEKGAEIFR